MELHVVLEDRDGVLDPAAAEQVAPDAIPLPLAELLRQPPGRDTISLTIMNRRMFTAILEREGDQFVALCPELDVASQGDTVEAATQNLREAVELFLDTASPQEIDDRLRGEVFVTTFEAPRG